jgi:hypothetical protein
MMRFQVVVAAVSLAVGAVGATGCGDNVSPQFEPAALDCASQAVSFCGQTASGPSPGYDSCVESYQTDVCRPRASVAVDKNDACIIAIFELPLNRAADWPAVCVAMWR